MKKLTNRTYIILSLVSYEVLPKRSDVERDINTNLAKKTKRSTNQISGIWLADVLDLAKNKNRASIQKSVVWSWVLYVGLSCEGVMDVEDDDEEEEEEEEEEDAGLSCEGVLDVEEVAIILLVSVA